MENEVQQSISYEDFSGAILDDLAVSDSLTPRNCVRKGINVMFDRPRGAIAQRLGTTSLGAVVSSGNTCRGLHNFRGAVAGLNVLYEAFNGKIVSYNGTSHTEEVTGLTATAKVRFLTYVDQVVALNGVDAARYSAGSGSWATSGGNMDLANWPTTTKYAAILNGRVFTAGSSSLPSRLFKSSIVSSNAISWTSGNGFVDVKPNDGAGGITSLFSNGRILMIFKERGMYRYDDNSLEYITGVGTLSNESVVMDDNGVIFFFGQGANNVGIYATTGGFPRKLSRPIQRWIEAISSSYYADIAAYTNGSKVVWAVGSITMGDTTYSNVHLAYNTADQTWEVYNYADSFRAFSQYINSSGAITVVGGDTDGYVQTIDSGYTDGIVSGVAGSPIFSECEMAPFWITKRQNTKEIGEIVTFCKDQQGLDFYIGADGGEFKHLGSLTDRETKFMDIKHLEGQTFYPRIVGVNSGPPYTFEGFAVTQYKDRGVIS